MTTKPHLHDELTPAERRFVRELAHDYAPEPMTGARRTAFDARLRERIAARRRPLLWLPTLAGAACAAMLAWLVIEDPARTPVAPTTRSSDYAALTAESESAWEEELTWIAADATAAGEATSTQEFESLLSDGEAEDDLFETSEGGELLPSEYAAIDGFFMDYVDEIDG